ncbi:MAG: T9SS type A sorting domain-containing protein, partial [Bacteroidia bacterium]|nr:T9SS type A sorting domain-containing protein [Bacteroidia bacterium]
DSNLSQTLSSSDKNSYSDIKWEPNEDSLTHKKDVKLLTRLIGNYPNPNSNYTIIKYKIGENCPVKIFITDMQGNKITELINKDTHSAGEFEVKFNTLELKSGVYFYTLQTDKYFQTKRMIIL